MYFIKWTRKSDFIVTENYHIRLKPATAKMLIEKISLHFNAVVPYQAKMHTYENILFDNVQHLANFIVGKRKDLHLVIPQVRIQRTDLLELQQKILTMSIAERRNLGINKSTLWYQKKHLTEAKRIKIYKKVFSKLESVT
jgi:CRISP-associated protein Cas1